MISEKFWNFLVHEFEVEDFLVIKEKYQILKSS